MTANREAAGASLIGQVLNGHRVVRQLGAGGMGQVFLARHQVLGHKRVIKLIRDDYQSEKSAADRFRREARVLAHLSHPGIVSIIDFGRLDNGWPWLCMEYIDGPDLDALVERSGPMSPEDAIETLYRVASALLYAHSEGVIHRDLKPGNILLSRGDPGLTKLIDFGLVKLVSDEMLTQLTADQELIGSPLYMSPEQIEAVRDLTPAVDVYALACTAFDLVCGEPPFTGSTVLEVITHHLQMEPPALVEKARGPVPPRLNALVDACLAKDPQVRPQMADVVAMLGELRAQHPYTPRPLEPFASPVAGSPADDDVEEDGPTQLPGQPVAIEDDDDDDAPTVIPGVEDLAQDVRGSFAAGRPEERGIDAGPRVVVAESMTAIAPDHDDGRLFFSDPAQSATIELVDPLRNQALAVATEIAAAIDRDLVVRCDSLRDSLDGVGMDLALAAGEPERESELREKASGFERQLRESQLALLRRVRTARPGAPADTETLYRELDTLIARLHEAVGSET